MSTFNLRFLAADKDIYEGPCKSLVVPVYDGSYGILPGHAAMISTIVPGEIKAEIEDRYIEDFLRKKGVKDINIDSLKDESKEKIVVVVEQGVITVNNNDVIIAVDSAEFVNEIDLIRAQKAADLANEKLLIKQSKIENQLTQAALARALNRVKAKNRNSLNN